MKSSFTPQVLVVHLVTDTEGMVYFKELFSVSKLYSSRRFLIVLHHVEEVCHDPLSLFLKTVQMKQSIHHSGKAGWCRIFVPQYFNQLKNTLTSAKSKIELILSNVVSSREHKIVECNEIIKNIFGSNIITLAKNTRGGHLPEFNLFTFGLQLISSQWLIPNQIITIETDQLILEDIRELWDQFNLFDVDDIIAAAENYEPWRKSSEYNKVIKTNEFQTILNDDEKFADNIHAVDTYHGK